MVKDQTRATGSSQARLGHWAAGSGGLILRMVGATESLNQARVTRSNLHFQIADFSELVEEGPGGGLGWRRVSSKWAWVWGWQSGWREGYRSSDIKRLSGGVRKGTEVCFPGDWVGGDNPPAKPTWGLSLAPALVPSSCVKTEVPLLRVLFRHLLETCGTTHPNPGLQGEWRSLESVRGSPAQDLL